MPYAELGLSLLVFLFASYLWMYFHNLSTEIPLLICVGAVVVRDIRACGVRDGAKHQKNKVDDFGNDCCINGENGQI